MKRVGWGKKRSRKKYLKGDEFIKMAKAVDGGMKQAALNLAGHAPYLVVDKRR